MEIWQIKVTSKEVIQYKIMLQLLLDVETKTFFSETKLIAHHLRKYIDKDLIFFIEHIDRQRINSIMVLV